MAGARWSTPLRVSLPWSGPEAVPSQVSVPVARAQAAARTAAVVIPWAMVVLGVLISLAAAFVITRELDDAVGGLGVELGAALWFGGVLTLGARRGATVGRAVSLLCLALAGVLLIAAAFLLDWSGAALDLALEYGVGAVAVAVIDVLLLGTLHQQLERIGGADDQVVTISVGREAPFISLTTTAGPGA